MGPAVVAEHLSKRFYDAFHLHYDQAVDDLSFEVPAGAGLALLGPTGAGKTTTLYMLLGLMRPTTGTASIFGCPAPQPASRQRVGFLAESVSMHGYYCPQDALRFYARLYGMDATAVEEHVDRALELTGLLTLARKEISTLSRGQVQRVGLAQALLADPDLVILDEPTANLDPVGRRELRNVLLGMRARGKTVMVSSHILSEVEAICDHLLMIDRGRLVHSGPLAPLLQAARRLRASGLSEQALAELGKVGTVIPGPAGEAEVMVPDREAQYQAITIIHQCGGELVGMRTAQNLEDIYLDLATEGELT